MGLFVHFLVTGQMSPTEYFLYDPRLKSISRFANPVKLWSHAKVMTRENYRFLHKKLCIGYTVHNFRQSDWELFLNNLTAVWKIWLKWTCYKFYVCKQKNYLKNRLHLMKNFYSIIFYVKNYININYLVWCLISELMTLLLFIGKINLPIKLFLTNH